MTPVTLRRSFAGCWRCASTAQTKSLIPFMDICAWSDTLGVTKELRKLAAEAAKARIAEDQRDQATRRPVQHLRPEAGTMLKAASCRRRGDLHANQDDQPGLQLVHHRRLRRANVTVPLTASACPPPKSSYRPSRRSSSATSRRQVRYRHRPHHQHRETSRSPSACSSSRESRSAPRCRLPRLAISPGPASER